MIATKRDSIEYLIKSSQRSVHGLTRDTDDVDALFFAEPWEGALNATEELTERAGAMVDSGGYFRLVPV